MIRALVTILVLGAITIGGMVDYSLAAKARGADYSFSDHVNARLQVARDLLPGGGGLAGLMPDAPIGWTERAGRLEDYFLVMGLPVDDARLAIIREMDSTFRSGIDGYASASRLYQNGDMIVMVDLTFIPGPSMLSPMARKLTGLNSYFLGRAGEPVMEAGTLAISELALPEYGSARQYIGVIGDQAYVSAFTNAAREEALALLRALDVAALERMVAESPIPAEAPEPAGTAAAPADAQGCRMEGVRKVCSAGN